MNKTPRVLNKTKKQGHVRAIDISPGSDSRWSNPFIARKDGRREEVREQFERWFLHSPDMRARWMRQNIGDLIGKDLMCTCRSVKTCHGQFLLEMAAREEMRARAAAKALHPSSNAHTRVSAAARISALRASTSSGDLSIA